MHSLKKELKKARLFEVQRISKRIKALERKRGSENQIQKNERKISRLKEELEIIKRLDLSELADHLSESTINTEQCHPQLDTDPPADLNDRAKWRILSSKSLQKFIRTSTIRTVEVRTKTIDSRTTIHGGHAEVTETHSSDSSNDQDDETSTDDQEDDIDSSLEDEAIPAPRLSSKRTMDSIFVSSLSTSNSLRGTKQTSKSKRAIRDTHKLQMKRNRLGQRARRKLWLSKYGDRATHLKRNRRNHLPTLTKRAHRDTTSTSTSRTRKQTSKTLESSSSTNTAAVALHPSWQASKMKKQQESGIGQFQGRKTVFADSDSD